MLNSATVFFSSTVHLFCFNIGASPTAFNKISTFAPSVITYEFLIKCVLKQQSYPLDQNTSSPNVNTLIYTPKMIMH